MEETSLCQFVGCGKPLPEQKPGQRRRIYCCDAHKLLAHRCRQIMKLQQAWRILPPDSQRHLEQLMTHYGTEAAQLALAAIQASYHDNENVFWLLRHFSQTDRP